MKEVAIFCHIRSEGPGYFATFLEANAIPYRLIHVGEPVPTNAAEFAGLCFMGGPMSVNDDLPWIAEELALIRDAVAQDIPVVGHCLGGQLMARALGGEVTRNPVKELGWGKVTATGANADWLGDVAGFEAFHWHGETFSLPAGATPLLASAYCQNQAFVLGPHLAMQCHVEMTESMIEQWSTDWAEETRAGGPAVQMPEAMRSAMSERVGAMRQVADRLYRHWISGLQF